MIKKITVMMLCSVISIYAISSDWFLYAKRVGFFLRMETGIESMRSDESNFSGQATGGKWLNDFCNVYMGIQQSVGRSTEESYTGIIMGTDVTLFDSEQFTTNVNQEFRIGPEEAMYFSPGFNMSYKLKSAVPMFFQFSVDEVICKRDTSWAEDDTETTIIESHAPKMYSMKTVLKMGYSRKIVKNQFLQLTINPFIRNNPVQGEKVVDLGFISIGYKFFLNNHLQLATELNLDIPQIGETTTIGLRVSLLTY